MLLPLREHEQPAASRPAAVVIATVAVRGCSCDQVAPWSLRAKPCRRQRRGGHVQAVAAVRRLRAAYEDAEADIVPPAAIWAPSLRGKAVFNHLHLEACLLTSSLVLCAFLVALLRCMVCRTLVPAPFHGPDVTRQGHFR